MESIYELVLEFKKKYPSTIAWRLKKHSKLLEEYLNLDEVVKYVFAGQNNYNWYDILFSAVIIITNKRLLIGTKRIFFNRHFITSLTFDLFNDLKINSGILFGSIEIDTVKENIFISNLSKKSLDEIETNITEYVIKEKRKYMKKDAK